MVSPNRPDLAAMQHTFPQSTGPTSVDLQAAAQRAVDQPHITYEGRRYNLVRQLDTFDLAELGEAIDRAAADPMGALGAINQCLREWLDDYPGLRAQFRTRHTGGVTDEAMEEYGRIAQDIFVASVARPTEAPAGSSGGRTSTLTSSKDDAPSTAPPVPAAVWPPYTPG